MRDHEQAAARLLPAAFEVRCQPVDGADVQVVGGLVQHEDTVVADEQARQVHAAALAAGELAHQALPGHVGDEPIRICRTRGLEAHSYSGMSPTTARCTVLSLARASRWPSTPTVTSRRRVTRPASGSSTPASTDSRLDLPSPFLPTMPMRSPSFTPRVTSSAIAGGKLQMHAIATQQNGHVRPLLALVFTAIHLSRTAAGAGAAVLRRRGGCRGGNRDAAGRAHAALHPSAPSPPITTTLGAAHMRNTRRCGRRGNCNLGLERPHASEQIASMWEDRRPMDAGRQPPRPVRRGAGRAPKPTLLARAPPRRAASPYENMPVR